MNLEGIAIEIDDDGVFLRWGAGRNSGGDTRGTQEIILKNNTKYRLVLTNATTTNNYVSWEFNHYIHPGV